MLAESATREREWTPGSQNPGFTMGRNEVPPELRRVDEPVVRQNPGLPIAAPPSSDLVRRIWEDERGITSLPARTAADFDAIGWPLEHTEESRRVAAALEAEYGFYFSFLPGMSAIVALSEGNVLGAVFAGVLELTGAAVILRSRRTPVMPGQAGAYSSLRGLADDGLTPHHMPQAALGFTSHGQGGALVLPHLEHTLTRTYGWQGAVTAAQEANLPFRTVLFRDIMDIRSIAGTRYNRGLLDLINYYRTRFPELLVK